MTEPMAVNREMFDTLADEYPTASWALWSDDFHEDRCLEENPDDVRDFLAAPEQRTRMTPSVVFVGLNLSGEILADLSNFHGLGQKMPNGGRYGQNDWRLKAFIQAARLSALIGGYMTDLSIVEESDSSNVTPADVDYESFADQLRLLDQDHYSVICFGNKAFDILRESVDAHAERGKDESPVSLRTFTASVADRPIHAYRVWHYSNHYNPGKYPELRAQLAYIAGARSGETDNDS